MRDFLTFGVMWFFSCIMVAFFSLGCAGVVATGLWALDFMETNQFSHLLMKYGHLVFLAVSFVVATAAFLGQKKKEHEKWQTNKSQTSSVPTDSSSSSRH